MRFSSQCCHATCLLFIDSSQDSKILPELIYAAKSNITYAMESLDDFV